MSNGMVTGTEWGGLPSSGVLPIGRLTAVFNDSTNAYKFYWFAAILDALKDGSDGHIRRSDLVWRMFEQVWYPLDCFKLNFGVNDSFVKLAVPLQEAKFKFAPGKRPFRLQLEEFIPDRKLKQSFLNKLQFTLYRYVPYRFLRPFFDDRVAVDAQVDALVRRRAKEAAAADPSLCPYHFTDEGIQLHAPWKEYLLEHRVLLEGFIHWSLVRYLERRNPNVPGISQKLFRPEVRQLNTARKAWAGYFARGGRRRCLFSGAELEGDFSLDHYVPWSYVVHDLNWNLAPVTGAVNSSKSDRLPHDRYLDAFAELQFDFFMTMRGTAEAKGLMDDYTLLFQKDLPAVLREGRAPFQQRIRETLSPMLQVARNSGFRDWPWP